MGSFQPDWESVCVNMMLDRITDPKIVYGDSFDRHLVRIYNLRLTHPNEEIYLFDDDAKEVFRRPKYHPDVASAFVFRISSYLMIPLRFTFGSSVSPQDQEPFARVKTHLVEALSHRRDIYPKYKHIIDKVEFSTRPSYDTTFVKAVPDTLNPGVLDFLKATYSMFVDDSIFANTESVIKHAMVASIEALYIVLGFTDETIRQKPLNLDKYFQSICSYERVQLGNLVNTKKMSVIITEKKRLDMITEFSNWHTKWKSFTLLQGVTLCGNLEFWTSTRP